MTDVSCRVVLDAIEFMERHGLSVDDFLAKVRSEIGDGPESSRAFLTNQNNWVSWRAFAAMSREWDRLYAGGLDDKFIAESIKDPFWYTAMLKPVLRVISTPSQLFWLIHKWAGPFNFPTISSTYENLGDGQIFLELRSKEGHEANPFFFRLTAKMFLKIPTLIGYPEGLVEADLGDTYGRYRIVVAPSLTFGARLLRRLKALYAVPLLITELAQRDAQLRNSYLKLVRARNDLEAKVRVRTRELEQANHDLSIQVEALRRAERVAHIGSWSYDLDKRQVTFSDEGCRIYGLSPAELPLTLDVVGQHLHPDDQASFVQAFQDVVHGKGKLVHEHRVIWPNGEIRHVTKRGTITYETDGRPARAEGTVHDITLQKQYEATLIEARNAADEANQAKTRFLANMSHEIRTPMSSILGFAELLGETELEPARRGAYLEKIMRNGRHLLALIDDALDLAKVEAGHLVIQATTCSPVAELMQTIDLLRPQAEAKGLDLRLEVTAPLPDTIRTDQVRLKQIMLNVIGNAIKFTRKGSVKVNVRHEGHHLAVTIEDTGGGIAVEDQSRLFQPFSQLPGEARHSGSGLGLALARRLARALGGDLILQSSVLGSGSVFRVTVRTDLPMEQAPRGLVLDGGSPITFLDQDASRHLDGLRILIAEDTPDIQELLRRVLEAVGATVSVASDGVECLETAARQSFDLFILDMHMPRLDGFQTVAELRRRGVKQPVIALTAYAMVDERKRSYEAGCDDFLAKPVETLTLLRTLEKWRNATSEQT